MVHRTLRHFIAPLCLLLAILACNMPSGSPETDTEAPQPGPGLDSVTVTAFAPTADSATAAATETATPSVSPTASVVTITADGGNLNVRRGPAIGYNPVSALLKGESSTAVARDATGEWLKIASIPKLPGQSGWVNARTKYSLVKGDVTSLPVETVAPPEPAYIINCTFHSMDVYPAGISVPPQNEKPKNKVEIPPGEYEVFDSTVAGGSPVASITVLEGETARIKKDGLGISYACP